MTGRSVVAPIPCPICGRELRIGSRTDYPYGETVSGFRCGQSARLEMMNSVSYSCAYVGGPCDDESLKDQAMMLMLMEM